MHFIAPWIFRLDTNSYFMSSWLYPRTLVPSVQSFLYYQPLVDQSLDWLNRTWVDLIQPCLANTVDLYRSWGNCQQMLSIEQKISNLLPISAVGPFRKQIPCAHDCRSTVCLHKRIETIGYTFSHLHDPGGAFWDISPVLAVHSTTRFSFGTPFKCRRARHISCVSWLP